MSRRGLPALRFLTLNVNGMRGMDRRRELFSTIMTAGYDIIALQETHQEANAHNGQPAGDPQAGAGGGGTAQGVRISEGEAWAREGAGPTLPWPGSAFWAPGVQGQRGVALLFSARAVEVLDPAFLAADPHGRYISATCIFDGKPLTVTAVYAPHTPGERCAFFTDSLLPRLDPTHLHLVGGDFNCIADPFRDQSLPVATPPAGVPAQAAVAPQRRCVGYVGGLQAVEDALGLVDCWRELYPGNETPGFTLARPGETMARLDRWLASPHVQGWVTQATVVLGLIGDHEGVCLTLVAKNSAARGPGMWRLQPWVCTDPDFCSLMEAQIPAFWQEHPPLEGQKRQRWEHFKLRIRDLAQSFMMRKSQQAKAARRVLNLAAEAAYEALCSNPQCRLRSAAWLHAKDALCALNAEWAKEVAAKAGFLLEHLGEKPTAWFHRLHKQRQAATTITHISAPGAALPTPLAGPGGKEAAAAAFTSYFTAAQPGGMFAQRHVNQDSQDTLLQALDSQLSQARHASCDVAVTRDELLTALLGTANNKAPGSDGLPFEFYRAFWGLVGQQLHDCCQEAFESAEEDALTPSQKVGVITLLFKGKGLPRDQPSSYRPITLLNTDYKILARAMACRWGSAADEVVDQTQTAFIPNRWIGDNVLAHLEEVDFCHECQVEGVLLFIDSAKAYDRLDVGWLLRCLEALGFGPNARRWVSLLHSGRQGCVRFNGWRTEPFPISSGVAQGSPLSPLLYVLAAQPLAAHLRRITDEGLLHGIPLPDGSLAPLSHQHADDLTVHVASLADAQVVMQGPIRLFCEASGAEVHAGKARGLHLGVLQPFVGADPGTGIQFVGPTEPIRHLGILLGTDVEACRTALYADLATRLERRVARWATSSLSLFGRTYVARQCFASMLTYHAMFLPPPAPFLRRAVDLLAHFVALGERVTPGRRAASLFPNRAVSALPWEQGGMRFPDLHAIVIALQSSVVSRLLRPRQAAWKAMFVQWLGRPREWVEAHPAVPRRDIDCWGMGLGTIFCTQQLPLHTAADEGVVGGVPARVRSYIRAFRRLHPHRADLATSFAAVMGEPLFFNAAITDPAGRPFGGAHWRLCAEAGIQRVGDLRRLFRPLVDNLQGAARQQEHLSAAEAQSLLRALPMAWQGFVLQPEEPLPDWAAWTEHPGAFLRRLDPMAPGMGVMLQVYRLQGVGRAATGRLVATGDAVAPTDVRRGSLIPAIADVWEGGSAGLRADPALPIFLFSGSQPWPFDPRAWMVGTSPVLRLSASVAAQRWRDVRLWEARSAHSAHLPLRPAIWEDDWGPDADPLQGLRACEQRHLRVVGGQPAAHYLAPPRRRPRGEGDGADPDWLDLQRPPAPRISVRERLATRAPPDPVRRGQGLPQQDARAFTDVLAPEEGLARPPWSHVWGGIAHCGLSHRERECAFRVLHGCVFTGVFKGYLHMTVPADALFCLHTSCGAPHFDTLSHTFLTCPLAQQLWRWLGDVWSALTDARFPVSAAVLMADDRRMWRPAPDAADLWVRLRILGLATLWKAHCRRSHGTPTPMPSVLAGFVSRVRAVIASDAALVDPDRPRYATIAGDTVRTPLPAFTRAAFLSRWGVRDILCSWPAAAARPVLHFTLVHPAPIPREGQG